MRWLAVFSVTLFLAGCSSDPDTRLPLIATTAMMESALNEIGGEHVSVTLLIPAGSCPGHYDIRPGDVQNIKRSRALFTHGYEQFVPRLLESVGEPKPRVCRVSIQENWQIPSAYAEACREISLLLANLDPDNAGEYTHRSEALDARLETLNSELLEKAKALDRLAVICSDQQAPFLSWAGLDVVATYGRSEEFTPGQLHKLVKTGREKEARLVIDNLQSGPAAGRQLARELGIAHLTLSNFPGGFEGTSTWERCVRTNIDLLLSAQQNDGEKQD